MGHPELVGELRRQNGGRLRFVLSHPFRDETAEWMGHPGLVLCGVLFDRKNHFEGLSRLFRGTILIRGL